MTPVSIFLPVMKLNMIIRLMRYKKLNHEIGLLLVLTDDGAPPGSFLHSFATTY